jgi:hypothetical protein
VTLLEALSVVEVKDAKDACRMPRQTREYGGVRLSAKTLFRFESDRPSAFVFCVSAFSLDRINLAILVLVCLPLSV